MEFDVHCISLERAYSDRRKYIDAWRPALGDRLKLFPAVDGRALPERLAFTRKSYKSIATQPAVACLMSHLAVMRAALAAGVGPEGVAVMEDDAVPVAGRCLWQAVAEARADVPALSILVLTTSLMGGWNERTTTHVSFPSRHRPTPSPGTQLVWYSARGLQTYISRFSSLPGMSDAFEFLPNDGSMGRLWKPAATHAPAASTIGYLRR